jgi:hypothetical protein
MWESQRLTTVWASTACYRDRLMFSSSILLCRNKIVLMTICIRTNGEHMDCNFKITTCFNRIAHQVAHHLEMKTLGYSVLVTN